MQGMVVGEEMTGVIWGVLQAWSYITRGIKGKEISQPYQCWSRNVMTS